MNIINAGRALDKHSRRIKRLELRREKAKDKSLWDKRNYGELSCAYQAREKLAGELADFLIADGWHVGK
jgi:hypothetical protein